MFGEIGKIGVKLFTGSIAKWALYLTIAVSAATIGYLGVRVYTLEKQCLRCEQERDNYKNKEELCRAINKAANDRMIAIEKECQRRIEYERNIPKKPTIDDTDVDDSYLNRIFNRLPKPPERAPNLAPPKDDLGSKPARKSTN